MSTIEVKNSIINLNVEVIAGDTLDNWSIKFSNTNNTPYDISDIDFYYVIKSSFNVPDSDALITKSPEEIVKTDSGSGTIDTVSILLSATETELDPGSYVHALKIIDGVSEYTWMSGIFKVITRKITTV